jgi:hypothetical protein
VDATTVADARIVAAAVLTVVADAPIAAVALAEGRVSNADPVVRGRTVVIRAAVPAHRAVRSSFPRC